MGWLDLLDLLELICRVLRLYRPNTTDDVLAEAVHTIGDPMHALVKECTRLKAVRALRKQCKRLRTLFR